MQTKLLEIRDVATMIPALAVRIEPENAEQEFLARHAGYGEPYCLVMLTFLSGGRKAEYDPFDWGDRTMTTAHQYIVSFWHELKDGDVIDVQFILGETTEKKVSERLG